MSMLSGSIELGDRGTIRDECFKNDVEITYSNFGVVVGCFFEGNVTLKAPTTPFKFKKDRTFIMNYVVGKLEVDGNVRHEGNMVHGVPEPWIKEDDE